MRQFAAASLNLSIFLLCSSLELVNVLWAALTFYKLLLFLYTNIPHPPETLLIYMNSTSNSFIQLLGDLEVIFLALAVSDLNCFRFSKHYQPPSSCSLWFEKLLSERQPLILLISHATPYKAELEKITKTILKFKLHWIVIKQKLPWTVNLLAQCKKLYWKRGKRTRGIYFIFIYLTPRYSP